MAIGIAAVLVILAVVFFVRQAGGEQRLYPDYTFNFSPLKTSAEVKQGRAAAHRLPYRWIRFGKSSPMFPITTCGSRG